MTVFLPTLRHVTASSCWRALKIGPITSTETLIADVNQQSLIRLLSKIPIDMLGRKSRCMRSAAEHIRRGEANLMLAGGADAAIIPSGMGGFIACKALSKRNDEPERASRPWDQGRDGFVMGEGAGKVAKACSAREVSESQDSSPVVMLLPPQQASQISSAVHICAEGLDRGPSLWPCQASSC